MSKIRPYIIAIDPGTSQSGVCIVHSWDYKPLHFVKIDNYRVMDWIDDKIKDLGIFYEDETIAVIERMENHGAFVNSDVFITCEWIGIFKKTLWDRNVDVDHVLRSQEKKAILGKVSGTDTEIRHALADRFAYGVPNCGKGTKSEQGFFYGFGNDIWQAYAVAVTYLDTKGYAE